MSRIVVFAGPTISQEQICALVPAAEVHPPVASGDLLRLFLAPGDLAAIIDGFYFQSGAVRHKEILALLKQGVHVWGAASMGAMRAAELAPLGMRGFGRIFDAYTSGEIEGDDEVAVLHASDDMGSTGLTEALVNIRYACARAVSQGIISAEDSDRIVAAAAALPFFERTYPRILQDARQQGVAEQTSAALLDFVRTHKPDLKRLDALELVQALSSPPREPVHAPCDLHETTFLRDWRIFGRSTSLDEHLHVKDVDVLTVCQLFSADYSRLHYRVLVRELARLARLAPPLDADATETAGELNSEQDLPTLLADPNFALMEDLAADYIARQCHLQVQQELPASLAQWLRPAELTLPWQQQMALLGVRLWQEPRGQSWYRVVIDTLRASTLFPVLLKLVVQARIFNNALREQDHKFDLQHLSPAQIYAWIIERWSVQNGDIKYALLERGFQNPHDLLERARPYYLYSKYVGIEQIHV